MTLVPVTDAHLVDEEVRAQGDGATSELIDFGRSAALVALPSDARVDLNYT